MARFYDRVVWNEKACGLYARVLLTVLLLSYYIYTSGHPGEFGIVSSTVARAAWASFRRADRWVYGLLDRPKRFVWFAPLTLVIGFVSHLCTMAVTIVSIPLIALFYPSARVMSEETGIRKSLKWLGYPGALAGSYHSIIMRSYHDDTDNGDLRLSVRYESPRTE